VPLPICSWRRHELQTHAIAPLVKNHVGAIGIYMVFETVRGSWPCLPAIFGPNCFHGLEANRIRTATQCPDGVTMVRLYRIYDPIFGQWELCRIYVTRTARLEPSTDTGKVFAEPSAVCFA